MLKKKITYDVIKCAALILKYTLNDIFYFVFHSTALIYSIKAMFILNLILLEPKVISVCHQYSARPVCTSMQSDQTLYCRLTNFQVLILISLKIIMDGSKNESC